LRHSPSPRALPRSAGCATTEPARTNFCNAEPVQGMVGKKADAQGGLAIRQATGADELRWGPPRTPMTMDFRPGPRHWSRTTTL
jgi:hypothetical protein